MAKTSSKRVMVNLMNKPAVMIHFHRQFTEKRGENPEILSP